MTQNHSSGASSVVLYGYETTYGTEVTGEKPFGAGVDINVSRNNNMERIYGVGSQNATASVAKQYDGKLSINFALANGNFFYGLLGTLTEGGSGPLYTHTYTESNTPPSFTVDNSIEMGTDDMVSSYVGCMINTATITASVNEVVKVSLDVLYKTETLSTSGVFTNVAETEEVFTFAHGTLEIPDGTTIATVQSVELTINRNLENIYGVGSRFSQAGITKQRNYDFRFTAAFNNITTALTYFLDGTNTATSPIATTPASQATLILTFTNGRDSPDTESIILTFATVYFNEETLPQNVNEVVKEDITGWAHSCTNVVWTNDDETAMSKL